MTEEEYTGLAMLILAVLYAAVVVKALMEGGIE